MSNILIFVEKSGEKCVEVARNCVTWPQLSKKVKNKATVAIGENNIEVLFLKNTVKTTCQVTLNSGETLKKVLSFSHGVWVLPAKSGTVTMHKLHIIKL